ncbi:Tetratricopeptide repeat-containing protein [Saccharicrinis carchari]|uniref:Tetratricopeptide repeat-containing protein n=1 Tax=Saccharicrinis carchari TaxID=1168039 RepID=A0A521B5Y5_SACCC|nr:tetratricopeptide repeat protein [Saccharicrinis carchari]SMO42518.1 Tetratricopeptide repeat-containing protein [Saccharicrinis carchari]
MRSLLSILLILIAAQTFAQKERKHIRSGNDQYNEGKFIESEIEYKKALDKLKEGKSSFEAEFNLGDAYFKQEKYEEAYNQFQSISREGLTKVQKSELWHNIGNTYITKKEIDKAIDAYKQALRNNPLDDETRYNLIAAMKMKEQQDQNKDQNQEQEQEQDKKDQEQEEQDKKDQKKKDQEQQKQDQNKEDQANKPEQQENQISKEAAERILNALDQDEQELQDEKRKIKGAPAKNIEKNW